MEKIRFNDNWKVWKDLDPFELIFRVPDDAVTVDLPYDAMFHEEQSDDSPHFPEFFRLNSINTSLS